MAVFGGGHPYSALLRRGVAEDIDSALWPPMPRDQLDIGTVFAYNLDFSIRRLVT
jgi:hypothetical protein